MKSGTNKKEKQPQWIHDHSLFSCRMPANCSFEALQKWIKSIQDQKVIKEAKNVEISFFDGQMIVSGKRLESEREMKYRLSPFSTASSGDKCTVCKKGHYVEYNIYEDLECDNRKCHFRVPKC